MTARHFTIIDPRADPQLDRVRDILNDEVVVAVDPGADLSRGAALGAAAKAVSDRLAKGDIIGRLDIVGHGRAGELTFGGSFEIASDRDAIRWLAQLRKKMTAKDTRVRLLGCMVGITGFEPESYSGSVLLMHLAHFLGVTVGAPLCPVFTSDFDAGGLSESFPTGGLLWVGPDTESVPTEPRTVDRWKNEGSPLAAERSLVLSALQRVIGTLNPRSALAQQFAAWGAGAPMRRFDSDLLVLPDQVLVVPPLRIESIIDGRAVRIIHALHGTVAVRTDLNFPPGALREPPLL